MNKELQDHEATKLAPTPASFSVVALGASAGGLQALQDLFAKLGTEPGVALVVIQHLDPDQPSMLAKILKKATGLPVVEAQSGMALEANRVHVIPSGADLLVNKRVLELVPRHKTGKLHLPIDTFFRSLAAGEGQRAIGVVLSGAGSDGTEGLRAIKAGSGITMAQDPESAQFPSMPQSAIAAGVVDFRGTPKQIAGELDRLSHHPSAAAEGTQNGASKEATESGQEASLALIFKALLEQANVDFKGYKRTTVLRRIERRMALCRSGDLAEYASALQRDPGETQMLAQDMLIHVTSFFRDPAAFEGLKEHVFEKIAQGQAPGDFVRIWVPGCATGEEAYSLVMCLLECLETGANDYTIKVFGTDLSEKAIETARLGMYPEASVAEVSPERLARFFERVDGRYRVNRAVRDLCVFVKHDITRDPPFAKLDLISCRNLLIYFEAELQRRVIPMLQYCLRPGGHLFLGESETLTGFRDLFEPVDKAHRIFQKTGDSARLTFPFAASRGAEVTLAVNREEAPRDRAREAQKQADHLLLARYAPPGVVVNSRSEIVQFRGWTGAYLESPPGQPQANLLQMARGGLAAHLHDALKEAKASGSGVRRENLRFESGAEVQTVTIEVAPLAAILDQRESFFLVLFEGQGMRSLAIERPMARSPNDTHGDPAETQEIDRLRVELIATRDYLQALVADHHSASDELAASNEELVAANEELQSTNEELQSAQEELQSTNEELSTLNDQFRVRNVELDQVANDLNNVLSSVEIPLIIVDPELRVRRFTPSVTQITSFITEDVGRSIADLNFKIDVTDLVERIRSVIDGKAPRQWDVQGPEGKWFRMQIRPYYMADNRTDGAVLSFVDVDALVRAVQDAEYARDYAKGIVETVPSALVVLDTDLRIVSTNDSFQDFFALSSESEGKHLSELCQEPSWARSVLRGALEQALAQRMPFSVLEITMALPELGVRKLVVNGRPIVRSGEAMLILLAFEDVTALRAFEAERTLLLKSEKEARIEAERATHAKDFFLATLSHELRTPLGTMLMSAQLLRQIAADDPRIERPSAAIERAANAQARLIDDLFDVSRIISGKLLLDLTSVEFAGIVEEAVDVARPSAQAKGVELEYAVEGFIGAIYGDAARLQQVVNNLLTNAIKFTPHGGRVTVRLKRKGNHAMVTVSDSGMGISAEVLPKLFDSFVQADHFVTQTHGGLGLGLSIVRHLVEVHGGRVWVESPGAGQGASFSVTLPLATGGLVAGPPVLSTDVNSIAGIRVLLVEDDDDTREACAAMLVALGAEVQAVASAAAGLACLAAFKPGVILSDIAMPGEDGYSFIKKVRSRKASEGGQTPAAALTALASGQDRRRAIEAGFQRHVAKPVNAVKLASVIRHLVDLDCRQEPPTPPIAN